MFINVCAHLISTRNYVKRKMNAIQIPVSMEAALMRPTGTYVTAHQVMKGCIVKLNQMNVNPTLVSMVPALKLSMYTPVPVMMVMMESIVIIT